MADSHRIWLPFPPSVNNLFSQGVVKGKIRRFPSRKYKAWRKEAGLRIQLARLPRIMGPVAVRLALTPPTAARRDVDNYSKAVLDALVDARVLVDDSNVQKLLSIWDHDADKPGVVVDIGVAAKKKPQLTAAERSALQRLKRGGYRLVTPTTRVSESVRSLVEKGYVRELPGLFDGAPPQGFAIAE